VLVRLAIFWWIIVDDTIHAFDVDSTSCNIGCNQSHAFSMLEPLHRHVTLALTQATV
jgi:hypothetical protein